MTASIAVEIPGHILIGTILNVALLGIMTSQVLMYHSNFKQDRLWMKLLVAALFVADIAHSVFMVTYLYDDVILHFGDVRHLLVSNWVFATDPALTGIIGCAVQLFFAWRVKVLTGKNWLVGVILLFALTGFLAAIGTAIYVSIYPHFIEFQKFKYIVYIWLVSAAAADTLVTVSLVWHLRHQKRGFSVTDDIIDKIIRLTVQTGLITTVWAIIDLVVYLSDPSAKHLIFNITLSKLYTNSLMSTLNSRGAWKASSGAGATSMEHSYDRHRADVVQLQVQSRPEVFVHVESREVKDPISKGDRGFARSQDSW